MNRLVPRWLTLPLLAAIYFGAGKVSLSLAQVNASASPIWLGSGLALAALLLGGRGIWPAVFAGAFALNASVPRPGMPVGLILAQAAGIAFGNTLEAVVGAWLVEKFARGRNAFYSLSGIFRYALLAAAASTTISATVGAMSLWKCGLMAAHQFGTVWLTWWVGDMVSVLVVAPLILVWAAGPEPRLTRAQWFEAVALMGSLALILYFICSDALLPSNYPFAFLLIPFLVWAALRFEACGVVLAVLAISTVTTVQTFNGRGPFSVGDPNTSLLILQAFICVVTLTALALAAAVAERKASGTLLRETNERLQLALSAIRMGVWTRDLDGSQSGWWSPETEAIFGLKPGEYDGTKKAFYDLIHPEDRAIVRQVAAEAIKNRVEYEVEFRFVQRDGRAGRMLSRGRALYDDDGKPVRLLGVDIDITARKEIEEALHKSEDRFRRLVATAHEGIWEMDTGSRTTYVNPRMAEMLGYAPDELMGRTPLDFVHPEDADRLRDGSAQRLGGQSEVLDLRFIQKSGATIWISAAISPLRDEKGMVVGILAMATDVTDKKRFEEQLLRLNTDLEKRVEERTAQLQATNKELEAFCYSVSHDLRAPLRTIRGFAEVLLEQYQSRLDKTGSDYLRRTCEASSHMDRLIDDLLKLSRVSRSEIQSREVNLSAVAEEIAADLKKSEPTRVVEFAITPGLQAQGDDRLMRLVLDNLLRNAWKFTGKCPQARIEFGFVNGDESAYFVRDNGAGFDMAYAGKLFGVFQRLHSASEFPGSGVGLAIVQRIIARHGGRVWAQGEVNAGATFYFALPAGGNVR